MIYHLRPTNPCYTIPRMATPNNESVYRPVLRDALVAAWQEKRLWPFAVFAAILLSGSVADVFWSKLNIFAPQASAFSTIIPFWEKASAAWSKLSATELILGSLQAFLLVAFGLVISCALIIASAISQAVIVYVIGARRRGRDISIRDALTVGTRSLWPVLVLNLLTLAVLMATRSLIAITLSIAMGVPTGLLFTLYLVAFITFTAVSVGAVVIQIYALNAMILQGATLLQGIVRGWNILRRHWIVSIETIALLFLISAGAYVLVITAGMILAIPYLILLAVATVFGSGFLFLATTILFMLFFVAIVLSVLAMAVLAQYAAWTYLYRIFGEGGFLPKIHRIVRSFFHQTKIPGA